MKPKGFTLIELLIVVAILGILAAMAFPGLQGISIQAKEAAAKDTLHTLRSQIGLYKVQHNGVAPGYMGVMQAPVTILGYQLIGTSAANGAAVSSTVPTSPYVYGPYMNKLPENPFNNLSNIKYIASPADFAATVDGKTSGWLYNKETAEIRINLTGSDSQNVNYYDY